MAEGSYSQESINYRQENDLMADDAAYLSERTMSRESSKQDKKDYMANETTGANHTSRLQAKSRPDDNEKGTRPPVDNIVDWDGPDDPEKPMNLPLWRKWCITMAASIFSFTTTFSSAVFSTATEVTAKEFHVSREVMILGTSLYLCGFIFGPYIFGPLSELYGRKRPLYLGYVIFGVFQIPVAVAQDLPTIMVCRFFQGLFGSAPQSIAGGILADIWTPYERGFSVPIFAASLFCGPCLSPIVGSFVTYSYLGWRWTQWLTAIMAFSFAIIAFPIVPETYAPILLTQRASRLRVTTQNWALHSRHEEKPATARDIVTKFLLRPMMMLILEPILLAVTIYIAFVFGVIYLCFEAFPISYIEHRHYSPGISSLPFLSVLIGAVAGCLLVAFTTKTRFAPDPEKGRPAEARLIYMAISGIALVIGLFWFAWTSLPSISPWPQIIAGAPIGFGIMLITLQGLNYIIDLYLQFANSALAANTSVRYAFAAGFPLFAPAMFDQLGVQWASTLLAFLALLLLPVPFLFYKYGTKLRAMSRYVPD